VSEAFKVQPIIANSAQLSLRRFLYMIEHSAQPDKLAKPDEEAQSSFIWSFSPALKAPTYLT